MALAKRILLCAYLVFFCVSGPVIAGDILKSGARPHYSQYDEEVIVRDYFNDRTGGFFVDIGAADYKQYSVTYYLEKHLGWSGIAVDAIEEYAEGYEKNRPGTKFFSYIVTDRSGEPMTFYKVVTERAGLSSIDKQYVDSALGSGAEGTQYIPVKIPTISLNDLLEQNGVVKIDFMNMDIEMAEPAALAGFDIKKYRPELACVETAHTHGEVDSYMTANGYEIIEEYRSRDRLNSYYRPAREKAAE